ncbi:MAG: phosphoribosylformylglycinamidine synthase, partial [Planctomycetota bacterium]
VLFDSNERLIEARRAGWAALRYVGENPNGSMGDLAGLCDESGRVFGLMPHPDRFVLEEQHPCWTSSPSRGEPDGLAMFRRAVGVARAEL